MSADAWTPLREGRKYLVQELDAAELAPRLYSKGVLTEADNSQVLADTDRKQRTEILLDLLESKDPHMVNIFLEVVGDTYPHVYLLLTGEDEDFDDGKGVFI